MTFGIFKITGNIAFRELGTYTFESAKEQIRSYGGMTNYKIETKKNVDFLCYCVSGSTANNRGFFLIENLESEYITHDEKLGDYIQW
jgi:endoglucanase Acf2